LKRLAVMLLLVTFGTWMLSGAVAGWALSRRPRPLFEEPVPRALSGALAERLQTSDGERLGAWFLAPSAGNPTVILLHGIADSRSGSIGVMRSLRQKGFGTLAVSQRAHGDSSGDTCDVGWSGRNDVIAAVSFVEQHAPGSPIVVFGVSMGAAASIFAAKALDHRVAGYILESPYADLDVAVRIRIEPMVSKPFDWFALNALRVWAPFFVHERLSTISPANHLADIPADIPVLVLAGGADSLAPLEDIEAMVKTSGSHVRLSVFPEAEHVQLASRYPDRYGVELETFLQSVSNGSGPGPGNGPVDAQ
jgi:alpha-beta hydrolase superfamily lysophospholipase